MSAPKLRFTNFKRSWDSGNLGGITIKIQDGNYGGLYPKPEEFVFEGVPFLTSKVIGTTGSFNFNKVDYITKEKNNELKKAQIISQDIIFTNRGASFGTTGIVPDYIKFGNIGPQLTLIRSNSSLVKSDYLFHYLNTAYSRNHVRKLDSGSAMNFIGLENTKKIPIKFPSLPEQEKIASFFTIIDQKLNLLKEKKEKLELYKKGVMQQIFSQKLRFKDENGNDFAEWEEKQLCSIGTTISGLTGKAGDDFGEGEFYIQYKQIFDDSKIDISRFGRVKISENEKQTKLKYGDVLFTTSSETPNEIGTSSVLLDHVDNLYLNSFCFGFRPNSLTETLPHYLRFLFRSNHFRIDLMKLAQGSTRFNMSKTEFLKLTTKLPSSSEQQKIADFLSALDTKINLVSTQIEKTELWKKGLLQQMFV